MDISECDTSQDLERTMKKRKQEQCDGFHEDNNMGIVCSEDASVIDATKSERDSTPDAAFIRCSNLESETGQSHLEICKSKGNDQEKELNNDHILSKNMDIEHENGNDSGNLILNNLNVRQFVAQYDTEKEERSSVNTEEYSRISEDPSAMRDHDYHTSIADVAQELSREMIDGRNDRDIIHHCTTNFSDSLDNLQCIEHECEEDRSSNCSYIGQINASCGNGALEKIVKGDVEEASVCCSVDDDDKISTLTPPCKPAELENAETVKEEDACFSAYGETSNGIDTIIQEHTLPVMSDTSEKGDSIGCSRKKLLVLDVNGLLADFIYYVPYGYQPDTIIGNKAVFKRPFCDDFIKFCFERFEVGVWSSRVRRNVDMVIDFLMGDFRQKLLFCWDQSHCTDTMFTTVENKHKPLVLKELKKLWKHLQPGGKYNASNTLLLDDSPHKALCNPANTAIFPVTYRFRDTEDTSLGPGGDLRVYLEGLSMAENVQKYVEQNPFGQRPITEKNTSWKFYRRVIYHVERRNYLDDASSFNCK